MTLIDNQQEQLRQEYLAALGVTLWLPRQVLPGAAASPVWDWHRVDPNVSAETALGAAKGNAPIALAATMSTAQESHRPVPKAMPLRQLLKDPISTPATTGLQSSATDASDEAWLSSVAGLEAQKGPAATTLDPEARGSLPVVLDKPAEQSITSKALVSEKASSETPASTLVPRFRLAMLGYSDCLIITELPNGPSLTWSAEHQTLLDGILRAVNLGGKDQSSSGVREFKWPLDPLASFDQSAPIARHALKVTLENALQAEHRVLLLMGRSAQEYLLSTEQENSLGQLVDFQGRSALCCHGLNEVLRLPKLKAELWRQLQPLRKPSGGN